MEFKRPILVEHKKVFSIPEKHPQHPQHPLLEQPERNLTLKDKRKITLSTLANLFVFFSLLGVSLWIYNLYTYKNQLKNQNMSIVHTTSQYPIYENDNHVLPNFSTAQNSSLDFATFSA